MRSRAKPPLSLKSAQWAKDYNEIKDLGAKNSMKRTARQTEDARFWLNVGPRAYSPCAQGPLRGPLPRRARRRKLYNRVVAS
jgi:hypothetical protein